MCVQSFITAQWKHCQFTIPTLQLEFLWSSSKQLIRYVHVACSSVQGFRACVNALMPAESFMPSVKTIVQVDFQYF